MKTRRSGIGSKLVACALAGVMCISPSLGSVRVADAQPRTAEDKGVQARQHFLEGKTRYEAGDFPGAYKEFLKADAIFPGVRPARYIGLTADKLRRNAEALAAYSRFLAAPPADMKAEADEIKARVAELRRTVPQATQTVARNQTEGERKMRAGDYAGALAAFQTADAAMVTPKVSFFIGQTYEQMGRPADAVPAYESFLLDPPKTMAREETEVRAHVEKIKAMPGKVHVETNPPGATVAIDGVASPSPTPNDYEVAAGKHTLMITMEGREPKEVPVEVTFASTTRLPGVDLVEKRALPPPVTTVPPVVATVAPPPTNTAPPTEPPPESRSKVPAFITGGLALAAAGVGTVFGVLALQDKSDYNKMPTSSKADDGENHALIADMAFFVAITLGVTSAVLFLTKDETAQAASAPAARNTASVKKKSTVTITAAPIVTPHGGGAGALIRF